MREKYHLLHVEMQCYVLYMFILVFENASFQMFYITFFVLSAIIIPYLWYLR